MLARRNGMIALEEHVKTPDQHHFRKISSFQETSSAVCSLRGIASNHRWQSKTGSIEDAPGNRTRSLEEEHHKPINVLTKTADAMPGFGIVAAVLVLSSRWVPSPVPSNKSAITSRPRLSERSLGILISYGFLNPLCGQYGFHRRAEMAYSRCIASSVVGFANGMAPIMAVEMARRGLDSEVKPEARRSGTTAASR